MLCSRTIEDDGGCGCCAFASFWECVLDDYDCSDGNNSLITDHVDLDWIESSLDWNERPLTVGDRLKNWKEKRIEAKRMNKTKNKISSWKLI
jgi:hypothetical protein